MLTLFLLAIALAMDAFAAALCQGAAAGSRSAVALRVAAAFGAAQGLMPLIGWGVGLAFASVIQAVDHWIALVLLVLLGVRMLQEGWVRDPAECAPPLAGWTLFAAAIGTSVDAAAAGVTLPLLGKPLALACAVIGATTAAACFGAVHLGGAVGTRLGRPAEMLGGVVLIALGIRIFVQHHFFGG